MLFWVLFAIFFNVTSARTFLSDISDPICGRPSIQPVIIETDIYKVLAGKIAKPHSWPWQVSLQTFENNHLNHICGGTIIARNKILCAAHCLKFGINQNRYEIVVGLHDRYVAEPTTSVYNIKNFSLPEGFDYNKNLIPDDIMVITLTENIMYNDNMIPICLAKHRAVVNTTCYVTGWGKNISETSDVTSAVLRQVDIPIQDPSLCKNRDIHGSTFNDTKMLCAGHREGGKDSCQGDAGGPLVCRESGKWFQYGIVSSGIGCGHKDKPAVYTLVPYYYDWLQKQIYSDMNESITTTTLPNFGANQQNIKGDETITTKSPKSGSKTEDINDSTCGNPSIVPVDSGRYNIRHTRLANDKILDGEEAKPHSWPWQVSLQTFQKNHLSHICSGTIISTNKILCAAHCFKFGVNKNRYEIVVGLHDQNATEPTSRVFNIKNFSLPEGFDYNKNLIPDDIMVITLTENIMYNDNMIPICLAKNPVVVGSTCYVTGWGRNVSATSDVTSAVLRQMDIPIQDPSLCKNRDIHGTNFNDTKMLCAGHREGGKGSCQGDSGGPLVCKKSNKWYQVGIVSTGIGCGQKDKPAIYTLVSYYYDWIQKQIHDNAN